ncbi:hypothetical protein [Nocardia puris]|uniref:Uncharacterized protein n=1 Tax=Nocardia puris TaxID=208602 RepID=A0A366CU85_9NOCA|nr:hypothetical protein [Nocardia puris]RBO78308.1 hypothetical protein DFR74_1522 [Nocardia puris]
MTDTCTTCGHPVDPHPYRHPITRLHRPADDARTDPTMTEADRMACEWSDYRKAYGIGSDPLTAAHKAFRAGWEAATGKTFEEGPLR